MSWGFQNAGPQVTAGPELQDIYTDSVGFNTIAGETKVRLAQPWPADKQPPVWASLLSIASNKALLAAATSESLILASTEKVRNAYRAEKPEDNLAPFTPDISLSVPQVSHVAFSSDESSLVITAQEGGGLAVYDVQALLQGKQESSFQLATNGISIRALAPNPAPENAHLFAVVLTDGKLMIADLKQGQLISTANGPVFREGVRCVSWSVRGKQLVAGLEDGSAVQYDPQGNVKAQIPKPSQLDQQIPMSSIVWIANDDFLVIHTPQSTDEAADSTYHMLHRDKASGTFTSQKFAGDPCMPGIGTERFPANFLISRLRKFPPNLEDVLFLCSSAGSEAGIITNASAPLANDTPVVNSYAITNMEVDSRRSTLPMSAVDGMSDTAPVGMDLDLSSTEKVMRPVPTDDQIEESPTPLPALMIMNNEGILSAWWFVYNESIRQKTAYPGLVSGASKQPEPVSAAQPAASSPAPSAPAATGFAAFGKPAFGTPSFGQASKPAFGQASTPAFGQPSTPAFGKPSTPAFGQASQPAFGKAAFGSPSVPFGGAAAAGSKASVWGTPAAQSPTQDAAKAPVFGSSLGAANGTATFGSPGGLGNKAPVWASSSGNQPTAFGQPSALGGAAASGSSGFAKFTSPPKDENKAPASPFATVQPKSPSASPFAAFAQSSSGNSTSPFAKAAANKPSPLSFGFGKPSESPAAPTPAAEETKEEAMDDETEEKPAEEKPAEEKPAEKPAEEKPAEEKPKEDATKEQSSPFAQVSKPQTSVFGQPSAKPQSSLFGQTPDKPKTSSLFGSSTDKAKSPASVFGQPAKLTGFQFGKPSDKPASPLRQPSSDKPSKLPTYGGFKLGSTFSGDGSAKDDLPAPKKDGGSMFGSAFSNMLGEATKEKQPAATIKKEPGTDSAKLQDVPPKEEESAVEPEEAPLPPDFTSFMPKKQDQEDLPPIAGSPPVDLGDEASGLPASDDEEEGDESWVQDSGEEDSEGEEGEEGEGESGESGDEGDEGEYDEESDEKEDESEADEDFTAAAQKASNTAFGSRLTFPPSSLSHSTGDAGNLLPPKSPVPSTTPAGLPKGPFFAPPSKAQESPRSPSPIRPTNTPAGLPASRQHSQPITVPSLKGHTRTHSRPSSAQRSKSPEVPDAGELSDEEDVRVREILASEVEPSKDLEPFIAHQDYVGHVGKPGIAGQIEKVYRDINSMLDTLGLNARTLEAFVKGHESQYKQSGRERSDLEDNDDWCLVEIRDLGVVQKEIADDMDAGKVENVATKLEELAELHKDATRLRTRTAEMRKQIGARADPQQVATHRASPLNNEAQTQQNELREGVAKVQKLLQDAEEALSVLRADLAAIPSQGTAAQRVPTVEAVTNTIMKMTAMIEQKSGDVDVLEAQIRRLPTNLANLSLGGDSNEDAAFLRSSVRSVRPLERSTSATRFGTPPATRGKPVDATPLGISGMLGRFGGSVRRDNGDGGVEFGRGSFMLEGTPRKRMADVSREEVEIYQGKAAQRKRVLAALKQTVEKKGTRVTGVERS